jgi:uncharacterized membrane protein YoaK (UPF0700 family)
LAPWRRASRNDIVLLLLAFASAATDVLAFLRLGDVFTSAMTGNAALLGISVGQARFLAALRSFTALAGFVAGAVAATGLGARRWPGALQAALGLELVCLGSFTALWLTQGMAPWRTPTFLLIALSAAGMGAQSVGARRIELPAIPTVVFTTTLTNICVLTTEAVIGRRPIPPEAIRQAVIFAAYLAGAILAAAIAAWSLAGIALLPVVAVAVALTLRLR